MSNSLTSILFVLVFVFFDIVFKPAWAEFEVCEVKECNAPNPELESCERQFLLFIPWLDTNCVDKNAARIQQASAAYDSCLLLKQLESTQCKLLNLTLKMQAAQSIPPANLFKSNGELCQSRSECKSGYCMPGPDVEIASSNVAAKSSGKWFCTAPSSNCALPDSNGGKYGQSLMTENGVLLVCQSAGAGHWAQFSPNKSTQ